MSANRLNIISVDAGVRKKENVGGPSRKSLEREEIKARFDRLWLRNPEKLDPRKNCLDRERILRTFNLISSHIDLKGIRVVDLGCGNGVLARMLRDHGASVDALDISSNALKEFIKEGDEGIEVTQDYVPYTKLKDKTYDLVVCTDVLADILPKLHRLLFSEVARIIHPDGIFICSTPIDIFSSDALSRFSEIASTEFDLLVWDISYHRLHQHAKNFLNSPEEFAKVLNNPSYRKQELHERSGLSRLWFKVNTSTPIAWFWKFVKPLCKPAIKLLNNNRQLLLLMEKISRLAWDQSAISNVVFVGKRKKLDFF
ncbi:MAG: 2-polyprenyl-3-methyl-5-hydroxy-6-metoxy-1,4-benzoquinol methylase [Chlamydiales bacterium]|jgi:2-polyprenyl-3-methyl-5-hydroxy-6-metoxy-1,4-benzoquinol methylase